MYVSCSKELFHLLSDDVFNITVGRTLSLYCWHYLFTLSQFGHRKSICKLFLLHHFKPFY